MEGRGRRLVSIFFGLSGFAGGAPFGDGADPEFCVAFVDFVGIEEFAVALLVPVGHILVLGVTGIGDGFKEGFEAGRTAAVLGRGAMIALDISRIFGSGLAIFNRFERDDMLPVVAHVIGIEQLANAPVDQCFDLGVFGRGQLIVRPVRIGKAVSPVARFELPEVIIEPAHRALDDIVQHLEVGIDWNFDPPPDQGISIGKRCAGGRQSWSCRPTNCNGADWRHVGCPVPRHELVPASGTSPMLHPYRRRRCWR